jgi:hypothetical protein
VWPLQACWSRSNPPAAIMGHIQRAPFYVGLYVVVCTLCGRHHSGAAAARGVGSCWLQERRMPQ